MIKCNRLIKPSAYPFFVVCFAIAITFSQTSLAVETGELDEEFTKKKASPNTFYGFFDHYFVENNKTTNRALATISSLAIPGVSQIYHEEYWKGLAHLSFFAANTATALEQKVNKSKASYASSVHKGYIYVSHSSLRKSLYNNWSLNTRFYSAFDAYRTASILQKTAGGKVPVSNESFGTLALAPFTPRYFTKPMVFAPIFLLGAYYLGRGSASQKESNTQTFILDGPTKDEAIGYGAMRYSGTAIGEEAFYRGVLNTEFIRAFGTYPGIFFSGVVFGFSHSGQGLSANAISASLYGFYLGYVHQRYDYQLGPAVALHFWWNAIIYSAVASHSKEFTIPLAHFVF